MTERHETVQRLNDLIDRWQPSRVIVVGDFMLDHIVYGNAERLSPDAPVPVLAVEREEFRPGGASNVCADLAALRCAVLCVGVVGDDAAGTQLGHLLKEAGCDAAGLVQAAQRPTTLKRSYVGLAQHRHPQKMFRADVESREPIADSVIERVVRRVADALDGAAALCLEDYDKGVLGADLCQRLIAMARDARVPVYVDPAAIDDYEKYRGATALTPNRTEAEKATGLRTDTRDGLETVAQRLQEELDLEALVLTLDKEGALLRTRDGHSRTVPTVARAVYDVTGAGDMVLAALASARAQEASWDDAVALANTAAGLEVEKFGVVPIPLEELHLAILTQDGEHLGKVRTAEQLAPELAAHRRVGKKVAFTNGCFDILHAGHVEVLQGARAQGDLLVLAVNADASIRALKGPQRPIVSETQRVRLLAALECVDYIVLFGDGSGGDADTPIPLLKALRPDVLVKGGTYAHDEVVGWDVVEAYGGRVVTIPPVEGLSTTNIVERIRAQDG